MPFPVVEDYLDRQDFCAADVEAECRFRVRRVFVGLRGDLGVGHLRHVRIGGRQFKGDNLLLAAGKGRKQEGREKNRQHTNDTPGHDHLSSVEGSPLLLFENSLPL
jgi:hypothetical protein